MSKTSKVESTRSMLLSEIKLRPSGDTRPLNISHILDIAESIAALGLIEPLVVDRDDHLLAGAHRLSACGILGVKKSLRWSALCKLLDNPPKEGSKTSLKLKAKLDSIVTIDGLDLSSVPVRVLDLDAASKDDKDKAFAIEAAENSQRRDYSRDEILSIYKRLDAAGYKEVRGRPKKGEKAIRPALSAIIGRDVRIVRKMLNEPENSGKDHLSSFLLSKKVSYFSLKSVKLLQDWPDDEHKEEAEEIRDLLSEALKQVLKLVDKIKKEEKERKVPDEVPKETATTRRDAVINKIIAHLLEVGDFLSKKQIKEGTGVTEDTYWKPAITFLIEEDLIVAKGKNRGRKYAAKNPDVG